jgi:SOS response regulatory protein OraA/RecX
MENINNKNQTDGTVTGVFNDKNDAEKAYSDLLKRGYKSEDITVLMSDETRKTHFKDDEQKSDLGS